MTIYSVPGTVPNTCTHCLTASANNLLNKGLPDLVTPMAFTQGSCLPHARSSPHPHSLSHSLRAAFLAPEHRGSGSPQGLCTPSFLCLELFPRWLAGWFSHRKCSLCATFTKKRPLTHRHLKSVPSCISLHFLFFCLHFLHSYLP